MTAWSCHGCRSDLCDVDAARWGLALTDVCPCTCHKEDVA